MAHIKKFEHLKIQLEAIKSATNNFADESFIGSGGFGKVHKGMITCFGRHAMVALKRLDRRFGQGDPEFWKEIMMLSLYKHENIVSLLGFCDDFGEKILVYEYVPNRSLDLYLNSDNLTWIGRLKICIGAARGLAYLHGADGSQQSLFHRDIKSANILLDEDMNAKISDFGLSKFGPSNEKYTFLFSNPVGTPGYCDPLTVETGLLTKESDVYSFGVVLFEVLCGRLCIDYNNVKQLPLIGLARKSYEQNTINEIVYSNIKDEINPYSLQVFATIAYQCLKPKREERPLMSDVVTALEIALRHQEGLEIACGGLFVVTIHEGNNLGRQPFVLLRVGPDLRTTTTKKGDNPVWEETFKFTLETPEATLRLDVRSDSWIDKKLLRYLVGVVEISVADVVKKGRMNNVYNVGNGRIHVELQWVPSAMPVKTKSKFLQFITSAYKVAIKGVEGE